MPPPPPDVRRCGLRWRMATYNCQGRGWGRRAADILEVLSCSVLALQSTSSELWAQSLSESRTPMNEHSQLGSWRDQIYDFLWQIRYLGQTPVERSYSWALPIPKLNGKIGCEAARLINLLDSFGKAWFGTTWQMTQREWNAHSYGFVPGRRREGAMLQLRCAQWWMIHLKQEWTTCYDDIKNAFLSVVRWRLDKVIEKVAPTTDQQLLKFRHQIALMMLPSNVSGESDELLCVEPRTGDLQGDPSAAQKYILAMDPYVEQLVEQNLGFTFDCQMWLQSSRNQWRISILHFFDNMTPKYREHRTLRSMSTFATSREPMVGYVLFWR
jgi:hypothetical protein